MKNTYLLLIVLWIAYPATISKVKARFPGAVVVIPGHGNQGGTGLVEHTLELSVR